MSDHAEKTLIFILESQMQRNDVLFQSIIQKVKAVLVSNELTKKEYAAIQLFQRGVNGKGAIANNTKRGIETKEGYTNR